MIDLLTARVRLLVVWCIGAGLVGLILLLRANAGAYETDPSAPWSWFGAAFVPTLTLMIGSAYSAEEGQRVVAKSLFNLTFFVCIAYVIAALLPIFATGRDPVGALKSALWVPAFQGVVTLFVAKLFSSSSVSKPSP